MIAERLFLGFLTRMLRVGELTLTLPDGTTRRFGPGGEPRAALVVHDARAFGRILKNPDLGLGECYMEGLISVPAEDLRSLIRLAILNEQAGDFPLAHRLVEGLRLVWRRAVQRSPIHVSRRNVAAHYDIPAEFYGLFMEPGRQYTCGYFPKGDETLEEAQEKKKAHIARKLLLRPGMRVMDIGCGWGGLAVTLAKDWGVHVTGITLSAEQKAAAEAFAAENGVSDQVEIRLCDYREVAEPFDRIVSVGMLEHVGAPQYRTYFRKLHDNLTEDGLALIHFIGRATPPGVSSPFFMKYIFPGAYTPALSEVLAAVEKSGLYSCDVEVWRGHYERTVRHWQQRFEANLPRVREMFDEGFVRMWRYYLTAAELVFSERYNLLFQVQLGRGRYAAPRTRDYLYPDADPVPRFGPGEPA
ncbi:SAM-dependent methyltransferase [Xinfangfangia pollutisoli]|uniref:SAM-dependent methyltransferase n=1 Tax=Xinfangfangia pollutisoli TaxID=2865960 RepID=UPI001CD3EED8|nr:cyclopropane-fatty-acyl-phospholipid synthase family protein [Xinfangfangia pollutisoli]